MSEAISFHVNSLALIIIRDGPELKDGMVDGTPGPGRAEPESRRKIGGRWEAEGDWEEGEGGVRTTTFQGPSISDVCKITPLDNIGMDRQ